jgi:CubicO group peptidase (beta-lactamase class C family)
VSDLEREVDAVASESRFSGVVRVDRGGELILERAYGFAERRLEVPNTPETQLATASGLKGFTALAVVSLVEDGTLSLETTARSVLGADLPLMSDDVTVEHLLSHRSGIWDYFDEDVDSDIAEYALPVPVHTLEGPEDFVSFLDGEPAKFPPGEGFSYCNGGYVVLALLAERAGGMPYHELVLERVCRPARMADTAFLRSNELPPRAALGYLAPDGLLTNVLHLPVVGVGDGGIYTTVADMRAFWTALMTGRIVSSEMVAEMTRSRSTAYEGSEYGLGFWLLAGTPTVELRGYDAGVSFHSCHDPESDTTSTVISNWQGGAWPVSKTLEERLYR